MYKRRKERKRGVHGSFSNIVVLSLSDLKKKSKPPKKIKTGLERIFDSKYRKSIISQIPQKKMAARHFTTILCEPKSILPYKLAITFT